MRILVLAAWVGLTSAASAIELRGIQACYGSLGPVRTSLEVSPLDEVVFRYTVASLRPAADGSAEFEVAITLVDASDKITLRESRTHRVELPWGGDSAAHATSVVVGPAAAPGEFTCRVVVTDKNGGGSAQFSRKLTCRKAGFRLINPRFFADAARSVPGPASGLVGQTNYLRVQATEPMWASGRSAVSLRIEVVDLESKPVAIRPIVARRESDRGGPFRGLAVEAAVPLVRPGEFQLRLTLIDELAKQEDVLMLPFTVSNP